MTKQQIDLFVEHPDAQGGAVPEEHEHDIEWSCRWLVRGHWRQQFYASTGTHKPIWILPYVKGPEDMPVKDDMRRVFAVDR